MLDKIYNIVKVLFILSVILKTLYCKYNKELASDYIGMIVIILIDFVF